MIRFTHLCITWGLAALIQGAPKGVVVRGTPNTTVYVAEVVSTTSVPIATSASSTKNASAHYIFSPKRKAVLVLHSDALRAGGRPKYQKGDVTSLKYVEYDDSGNVLNTVFMYELKDVARFFEMYLDTKVCHESCDETN